MGLRRAISISRYVMMHGGNLFNHELNDRVYVGKYPIITSM